MSNFNNGGPAFPVAVPFGAHNPQNADEAKRLAEGMTLRQYAAIKLRVPNSGTDWLDEMIVQSLRDGFAAKAMQAHITSSMAVLAKAHCGDPDAVNPIIANASYEMADAMLRAREGK